MDRRRRAERGASGVEVALIITLVAIVAVGGLKLVGGGSEETLTSAKVGIDGGDGGGSSGDGTGGGGTGGGGSSSGTGGGGSSAPTTTAPSPATTAPAPTTTVATTTTTEPPPPATAAPMLAPLTAEVIGSSEWRATSAVELIGDDGTPVADATVEVSVRRRERRSDGRYRWRTTTTEVTTGSDGTVDLEVGPWDRWGTGSVREVQVTVIEVTPPEPTTWDGSQPTASTDAP